MKMLRKVLFGFCLCLMICFASTMTFHESTNVFGAIEVQAATVKLNKKTVVLNRNSFMNLKMIGTKAKVTWKSSNKKIVSVTSKGKIKGLKAGKANIYAKVNGKTYKCSVTVEDPKIVIPNSIEIAADKESGYALKGTKVALKVYGTKNKVKWSVNAFANPRDKASITSNGVVTLKQSGTIWVLAEVNGSIFCRFTIYIEDPEFDYNPDYIVAGVPYEFELKGIKRMPTWGIQNNNIASLESNGKKCVVTGKNVGTTYLTAKVGTKTYKQKLNVKKVFEVEKTQVTCSKETKVNVYLRDSGKVTYDIEDSSIVSCKWGGFVDDKTQLIITPKRNGSTNITITNTCNSEKAVIRVTVTGLPTYGEEINFNASLYADRTPTLVILLEFTNTGTKPIIIDGLGVLSTNGINTNMITFGDKGFIENTRVQPGASVSLGLVKTNLGYFNVSSSSIYGFYLTYNGEKYIAIISYNGQLLKLTKGGRNTLLGETFNNDNYSAESFVETAGIYKQILLRKPTKMDDIASISR